jgi:hypothetical protein
MSEESVAAVIGGTRWGFAVSLTTMTAVLTIVWLTQEVAFDISCWDCVSSDPLILVIAQVIALLALYVLGLYWNGRTSDFAARIGYAVWTYGMLTTLMLALLVPLIVEESDPHTGASVRILLFSALCAELVTIWRIVKRRRIRAT